METCKGCGTELGNKFTITAILGEILCNDCASVKYSKRKLEACAEHIVPGDIGIEAHTCNWCSEEDEELYRTDLGYLCGTCILAIRSRGEEVIQYD